MAPPRKKASRQNASPQDVASRDVLQALQLAKLRKLTASVLESNAFYQDKLTAAGVVGVPESIDDFRGFPFTSKPELALDRADHPPYGSNLTYPLEHYTRFCQTSGTSGTPMPWLDTNESWASMLDCWEQVYLAAGVDPEYDRIFFAFSFGPFLGFWTAYEAAVRMGCLTIPGGGMSSTARLACMEANAATVLCCTPTYALRLGELLGDELPDIAVNKIIVAGETGGSVPGTRGLISKRWRGAEVFDHHGMTEVGPVSYPTQLVPNSLGVLEEYYFAEVIDPESGDEVGDGETGELVLTTLERDGCPLLRYRTGDLVKKRMVDDPERGPTLVLEGGILGRLDDMIVVRGVNIYPSAVEGVIRQFPEVAEFQGRVSTREAMAELEIALELREDVGNAEAVGRGVQRKLGDAFALRIPVVVVPPGGLPREEFKSRRFVRVD